MYYSYEAKNMYTSGPHCVPGSRSVEAEMYTSETHKNTEMKFISYEVYYSQFLIYGFHINCNTNPQGLFK
jgi:hypothetical protein